MLKYINSTKSLSVIGVLFTLILLGCETAELKVATPPDSPTNITVAGISSSGASLKWVAPKEKGIDTSGDQSTIKEYGILYTKDPSFKKDVQKISPTKTGIVLDKLDSSTDYYVRIKSVNAVDLSSSYTEDFIFSTLQEPKPPQPPSTIRVDKIENDEVTISWDKPNLGSSSDGKISGLKSYKIIYGKTIALEKQTEVLIIDKEMAKIIDLDYDVKYYFKILTTSDLDLGSEYSDTKSFNIAQATYYTVTFDLNGGMGDASAQVAKNKVLTSSKTPTKQGQSFEGWYSDSGLKTPYDFAASVRSDITLYANWVNKKYTVTFDVDGGTDVQPMTLEFNSAIPEPTPPTKTGEVFGGWYTEAALTNSYNFTNSKITKDIILYAKWDTSQYTVTFESNGGDRVNPQTIDYNMTVNRPANPNKNGESFDGWYTDSSFNTLYQFTDGVTADLKLYAKWIITQYNVTFETNGGTGIADEKVNHNDMLTQPNDPFRIGHTFMGWYRNSSLTVSYSFSNRVTSDLKLYAKWEINKYQVTFNSNGGTPVKAETVNHGNSVPRPTPPTRSPDTFGGWYRDSGLKVQHDFAADKITADITLYAKWN